MNPITGDFQLVQATAWNASYEHWFNEHWLMNFTYSQAIASNNAGQPGTTYDHGQYFADSLWWIPVPRLSIGIEYLWGERENLNGQSAMRNVSTVCSSTTSDGWKTSVLRSRGFPTRFHRGHRKPCRRLQTLAESTIVTGEML